MPRPTRTKGQCLSPDCPRDRQVRGLCRPCYRAFERAVAAGEVTEQQAVEAGLILPPYRARRKNLAWFRCQLPLPFVGELCAVSAQFTD